MEERSRTASGVLWGRILSVFALVLCIPLGLYFVSITVEFLGVILGIAGYSMGARRLGSLAVVLCTVAMFVGYLIGQSVGR